MKTKENEICKSLKFPRIPKLYPKLGNREIPIGCDQTHYVPLKSVQVGRPSFTVHPLHCPLYLLTAVTKKIDEMIE